MKAQEVEKQLNDFLSKRSFWNARYLSEIKRLHNIAPHKYKNKVKQEICNKIAEKIAGSEYARSYKSFFNKGNFTPYSIFFKALFVTHMQKELSQVLQLTIFSETSSSTGSRKAIELAMKSYPKALNWNEPKALEELKNAIAVIETFDQEKASIEATQELCIALEILVHTEAKTSSEIVTIKAYSKLSRLQVHFQNTDIHDLATLAFNKACTLI
ncbi:hypothetical protein ACQ9ZH_20900 [Pseudomonas chlororaphis]